MKPRGHQTDWGNFHKNEKHKKWPKIPSILGKECPRIITKLIHPARKNHVGGHIQDIYLTSRTIESHFISEYLALLGSARSVIKYQQRRLSKWARKYHWNVHLYFSRKRAPRTSHDVGLWFIPNGIWKFTLLPWVVPPTAYFRRLFIALPYVSLMKMKVCRMDYSLDLNIAPKLSQNA